MCLWVNAFFSMFSSMSVKCKYILLCAKVNNVYIMYIKT